MRFLATLIAFLLTSLSLAQQIDLSTLPPRDSVQLTIYNSEDITLVRETRHVTVKKGVNELQFSWANTLIDPTSVTLGFVARANELEIRDTRYPHDRPQVLYWNVESKFDGDAEFEITYFTSGISWAADYVGVTDGGETSMRFDGYVTIINNSGADYEDAQVRMVVGTINLVEKIRELAQRGLVPMPVADAADKKPMREMPPEAKEQARYALQSSFARQDLEKAKAIVKEGLSEYFIFTVPGEETIPTGWSKRMRLFEGTKVPLKTVYRYRPAEYGDQLVRMHLVRNDTASTLGESPLPDGTVRLFRLQPTGGLSVIAFVNTKYVPIGQEFEFNLGRDPQVILERIAKNTTRDDFWFQRGNNEKRLWSPDKGEKIEPNDKVVGWTTHENRVERVRNYRSEPIDVEFRFPIDGDVTFRSALSPTLYDFRTPDFKAFLKPAETKELAYEVARREGTNAKQQAVTLEATK